MHSLLMIVLFLVSLSLVYLAYILLAARIVKYLAKGIREGLREAERDNTP